MAGPKWQHAVADADRTWFTSDMHFGHSKIIDYCNRPYSSVPEMNDGLVANWNQLVSPDDDVWVLGDVAMGRLADSLSYVRQLNGHKKLVCGNHDRAWAGDNKSADGERQYHDAGFEEIFDRVVLQLGDVPVSLCHFPSSGDSQDKDRYLQWRPTDAPTDWLLHGHVHERWQARLDHREINVGVDVWDYRPVHATTLLEVIQGN